MLFGFFNFEPRIKRDAHVTLAEQQLAQARVELLEAQLEEDRAKSVVLKLQGRIERLTAIVKINEEADHLARRLTPLRGENARANTGT